MISCADGRCVLQGPVTMATATQVLEESARVFSGDRIVVDPGFGFGKTRSHNIALMRGLPAIAALVQAMALCQEREMSPEPASDLEARWNALEHLPAPWKTKLQARFLRGKPDSAVSLPEMLLDLEIACGIESPSEFEADRQRLKLRALKEAMESRRSPATTQDDIERRLIDAAALPCPDELSRERLARIIAAVQRAQRR